MLPSPPTIRAGRISVRCADARRRRSGGNAPLARALLLDGERAEAQKLVREAWRDDNFSGALEAQILDVFGDLIIDADHKTRMDMRLYAEDVDGTMRSANAPAATRLLLPRPE